MLLNFFKRNFELSFIFLFLSGIACWSYFFIHPFSINAPIGFCPLYETIYHTLVDNPIWLNLSTLALVLLESILVNLMLIRRNILGSKSWLPAFIFILFYFMMMQYPFGLCLLSCCLFITFAFQQIISLYDNDANYEKIFWAGLCIGLASLIYFPAIIFVLFACFSLINFSFYKIRKWLILALGVFIPYLYLGTYYLFTNALANFAEIGFYFNALLTVPNIHSIRLENLIFAGTFILLFVICFFFVSQKRQEKSIAFRKKTNVFLIYLFFCLLLLWENKNIGIFFAGIPFVSIFSLFILENKRKTLAECILLIYIGLTIFKVIWIK